MTIIAALVLLSTALPALIAGLVLLNTGLIQWLDGENDIPFGLPEWARLGILIPMLAAVGTGLTAWQNGGQFADALLVGFFGVGPGIVLVLLGKLSAWFKARQQPTGEVTPVDELAQPYPVVNARHRKAIVGAGSTVVPRGQGATVSIQLQRLFRFDRLVIPSSIAGFFAVLNITVDNQSVFVSSDSIPGTAFLPDAAPTEFGVTCGVGHTIKITVENQETVASPAMARVFTAHLEGLTVR
jgi:hypothetical protein